MQVEVLASLDQVAAGQWNALVRDNNPFVRHEFLAALEHHGCVGEAFGWLPRHLLVRDQGHLVGAMPLYEKYNSYGEFVFDHAWADAYKRHGLNYFPKLVSAIPYTPAGGQRLLVQPGREPEIYPLLLGAALQLTRELEAGSFHCLFPLAQEQDFMEQQHLIMRHDCQFHWPNLGYSCFEDFLARLVTKKRKNIRQERRKVQDAGVQVRCLDGHTASPADWSRFAFFYRHTFESKWGFPTLNEGFFREVAEKLPEQVLLVMVDQDGECIAGALMFSSATRLYGRHWGCTEYFDSLHFEACYYQGIEHCIHRGLQVFEPGAQGEHKLARGFVPTLTRSSHWVADDAFREPIRQYSLRECQGVEAYMQSMQQHLPYRDNMLETLSGGSTGRKSGG